MVRRVNRAVKRHAGPKYTRYAFVHFDGKNSNLSPVQLKLRDSASIGAGADMAGARARFNEARDNGRTLAQQVMADITAGTENYRLCYSGRFA